MVSEHMLTVGRDPRNWQSHRKIFLYNFLFKRIFYLSSLLSLFKYSLFVRPCPFFPFDHSKIRLMRPLQEVQDIRPVRPFGTKRILPYIMIMETTTDEDSEESDITNMGFMTQHSSHTSNSTCGSLTCLSTDIYK